MSKEGRAATFQHRTTQAGIQRMRKQSCIAIPERGSKPQLSAWIRQLLPSSPVSVFVQANGRGALLYKSRENAGAGGRRRNGTEEAKPRFCYVWAPEEPVDV